jgi:uncharacterized membrane protein
MKKETELIYRLPLPVFKAVFILFLLSCLASALYLLKGFMFQNWHGLYLHWNLFLGWIPLFMAVWGKSQTAKFKLLVVSGLWLLFFPNAPYIITDFIHLSPVNNTHYWVTLFYTWLFAIVGLACGMLSLYWMHQNWLRVYSKFSANVMLYGSLGLSGYGLYLGRFHRWNSWDAFVHPLRLVIDLKLSLYQDFTWFISAQFALLVGAMYLLFWAMIKLGQEGF